MKYIDMILYLIWNWLSGAVAEFSLWMSRMALAHYVASKLEVPFALRKLDTSIFVVVYRNNETRESKTATVFATNNLERVKAYFEKENNAKITFFKNIAEIRQGTAAAVGKEIVYL